MRMLIAAAAVAAFSAGTALAQDVQETTASHSTNQTTTDKKGNESYEWSVDTTTTKVPVHPTVTEKTTTTTTAAVAPPTPIIHQRDTTTTTTSTGGQ